MAPSTRLHLRFAAATAVVIATAGVGLLVFVAHHATVHAQRDTAAHTMFIEETLLRARADKGRSLASACGSGAAAGRCADPLARADRRRPARQDLRPRRPGRVLERALADRVRDRRPGRVQLGSRGQGGPRRHAPRRGGRPWEEREGARGLRAAANAGQHATRRRVRALRVVRTGGRATCVPSSSRSPACCSPRSSFSGRRSSRSSSAWLAQSSATASPGTTPRLRSNRPPSSCGRRRRWRRSAGSPAASRMTSTTSCWRSTATPTSSSTRSSTSASSASRARSGRPATVPRR